MIVFYVFMFLFNILNQDSQTSRNEFFVYFYEEYITVNEEINYRLYPVQISLGDELTVESKVRILCDNLFNNEDEYISLIPGTPEIIYLDYKDQHLELTVTNDIMNYGGNSWEWDLVNQLLSTLFSVDEINRVTINIYGEAYFREGTVINQYTREQWNERKKIICQELMEEKVMN
ncbi:hypothetical protein EDC18_11460 [Natranaerovirga pectinivora]|uniref:Sporulation and spore germination protein n=1 Tax=Natranaerovirga pectinivora TaxID=682400 RepID=A0A4R3MED8_9FIRM|nr:hypothetical protein [Natranaerovirga pectinivora]TCT12154.1 hypothetical protein EDC18_11460 [Natranaerovirga pectinivora]